MLQVRTSAAIRTIRSATSDVDAAGNFIGDPKTFPRETFFSVKTDEANNETFEKYIAHAHIFVDSSATSDGFRLGNVGGYTASYVSSLEGFDMRVSVLKNTACAPSTPRGCLVIIMIDQNGMFSDDELSRIVQSAVPGTLTD